MFTALRPAVLLGLMLLISGCATTTVTKNPGPRDKGIRFYRPKPYLLVKPLHYDATKGGDVVAISIEYLPDYNEEYSIRARGGLGTNATDVSLTNGWMLSTINQKLDSQFDDNVSAVGSLIGSLPGLTSRAGNGQGQAAPAPRVSSDISMQCVARNVPYGLYEPVFGNDQHGCKHLYGWRYVGFAPFMPCPVTSGGGGDCFNCQSLELYGLISENGIMAFVPLHKLQDMPMNFPTTETAPKLTQESGKKVAEKVVAASAPALNVISVVPGETMIVTVEYPMTWLEPNDEQILLDELTKAMKAEFKSQIKCIRIVPVKKGEKLPAPPTPAAAAPVFEPAPIPLTFQGQGM